MDKGKEVSICSCDLRPPISSASALTLPSSFGPGDADSPSASGGGHMTEV